MLAQIPFIFLTKPFGVFHIGNRFNYFDNWTLMLWLRVTERYLITYEQNTVINSWENSTWKTLSGLLD